MLRRLMIASSSPTTDPYWANVVSLLHFDGADGSTTFTDESGKIWTAHGSAQIDTAQSKFGGGALLLDGSNAYISTAAHADFGFGTGDFTVEAWVRYSSIPSTDFCIFDLRTGSGHNGLFYIYPGSGRLTYYNGTTYGNVGAAPSTGAWAHVAFTRAGGTLRGFLGGALQWSVLMAGDFGATRPCRIGNNFAGSSGAVGHIDEARITKGVARYTENFTPPSAPFPAS